MQDTAYLKLAQHSLYAELNKELVDCIDLSGYSSFVDLGCGTGSLSEIVGLKTGNSAKIWAIDPEPDMVETVRTRLGHSLGVLRAGGEDFGELFPPEVIDVIFVANAIHLVDDIGMVFRNAERILKPGGLIAFSTTFYEGGFHPRDRGLAMELIREARKFLTQEHPELVPAVGVRSLANRPLTAQTYRECLTAAGMLEVEFKERIHQLPLAIVTDILATPVFASGALPGVPAEFAARALGAAAERILANDVDLRKQSISRTWLYGIARKVSDE